MPKGRLEYLKRLLPFLQNQSEDCLYLNVFSPAHGMFTTSVRFVYRFDLFFFVVVVFTIDHSLSSCCPELRFEREE